jgi:hypothetical protein
MISVPPSRGQLLQDLTKEVERWRVAGFVGGFVICVLLAKIMVQADELEACQINCLPRWDYRNSP